jgi:hypothetical protein
MFQSFILQLIFIRQEMSLQAVTKISKMLSRKGNNSGARAVKKRRAPETVRSATMKIAAEQKAQ